MFRTRTPRLVALATAYADQSENETGDEFVIPEDLSTLTDEQLSALHQEAVGHFDALYGDGQNLSEEDLEALAALTEGIETLATAQSEREQAATERAERAAELAARARGGELSADTDNDEESSEDEDESDDGEESTDEDEQTTDDEGAAETVTASAERRRGVRLDLRRVASRQLPRQRTEQRPGTPTSMRDLVHAAGEGTGFAAGEGVDWLGVGQIVDRRLGSFNLNQYKAAAQAGRHLRQQFGVVTIDRPIPADLRIQSNDPAHVEEVLQRAVSETRLPGNSLVAAGGWCAPSETIYDLLELETRDGIFSLPEVGFARGGISRTLGPDFADLFAAATGFHYTEEQDVAGTYGVDENGVGDDTEGDKPCFRVDCPDFEEFRLEVDGLCITAGLLQQRGYPEVIARTVRGALVAHDHRLAGRRLLDVVAGSDAVTMAAGQQSATASILAAIELQVELLRTRTRISRAATMEAVFPFWVRAVIRNDLARRNGVMALDVTDAQIAAWFALRGIAPQFVYNWQDLNTATTTVQYPETVQFLIYPAGTWVQGASDIITLDSLFDSTLLGQNDYTALFTEEGQVVVKMGHESRVVTVPVIPDGTTGAQVEFDADGTTIVPVEPEPAP